MKTKLLILTVIAFALSACSNNAHRYQSKPADFTVDPHYCQNLMREIHSTQSLHNSQQHTAITKSRLLQQYQDFGCGQG
ncbi:MAG: hypothetical protein K0U29_00540 [Gammaproteobacteria bacterium]|nr:hypothetical protein [Gammaproteobacteria bacterium]MCH9743394.1 hypothetical protein [Gammaproteobacteria bacterium]